MDPILNKDGKIASHNVEKAFNKYSALYLERCIVFLYYSDNEILYILSVTREDYSLSSISD